MFDINKILVSHLRTLKPYSSARDEFSGRARVFLDANENAYGASFRGVTALNRYPDPRQQELKEMISRSEGVAAGRIFIGNGSDEIIDLLIRAFCEPGKSSVIINTPTYGMYAVQAAINNITVREVPLDASFEPDTEAIEKNIDSNTRIIFICSPNNPTGNLAPRDTIRRLASSFNGLIVIDEAYIGFSDTEGLKDLLDEFPGIVIMRTFSKARGMAGARLGYAFASHDLIEILSRIKLPYNVNSLTLAAAASLMQREEVWRKQAEITVTERERVAAKLNGMEGILKVCPSAANFLLVKVSDPRSLYQGLAAQGIVVRDRSSMRGCEGCIRITIGTPAENNLLLDALEEWFSRERDNVTVAQTEAMEARKRRVTRETDILVDVRLRGKGVSDIQTGSGFFDHMLEQLGFHGNMDLLIRVSGDVETGMHHIVEDVAITVGQTLREALGDRRGIRRYGFTLPMDESIATVAVDMGGRGNLVWDVSFRGEMTGDIPVEMYSHFFSSFAAAAGCTIHITASGENDHHIAEAIFKAFARATRDAVAVDSTGRLPSTKGVI
jgi:histidinol-phosphate aminotransferase